VIVPVGDEPPDKAAVSRTVLPTGPPGLGVVAMTGEDFGALMVTCSAPQPETAGALPASPP